MATTIGIILLVAISANDASEASSKAMLVNNFNDQDVHQAPGAAANQEVSKHEMKNQDDSAAAPHGRPYLQNSVSSLMAKAMARRVVHNDLLMVGSRIAQRRTIGFLKEGRHTSHSSWPWTVILLVILIMAIMLLLNFVSREPELPMEHKPMVVPGGSVDPFLSRGKQSPPMSQLRTPSQQQSPSAQRLLGSGTQAVTATGSPLQPVLQSIGLGGSTLLSPVSASRAAWPTVPGVPPPLQPREVPPSHAKTFRVAVASLRKLYARAPIEITSEFDYPQYYARLAYGPEGSRMEIAADPSWRDLVATIGRLDYPAALSPDAMLHGPDREFYGPFQRYAGGFSVGHWSNGGTPVLTLTPRSKFAGGFYIEVRSGGTEVGGVQSIDNGTRYQVNIKGGIDNVLIITSVLAAFVASQPMIDDSGTRI